MGVFYFNKKKVECFQSQPPSDREKVCYTQNRLLSLFKNNCQVTTSSMEKDVDDSCSSQIMKNTKVEKDTCGVVDSCTF